MGNDKAGFHSAKDEETGKKGALSRNILTGKIFYTKPQSFALYSTKVLNRKISKQKIWFTGGKRSVTRQ